MTFDRKFCVSMFKRTENIPMDNDFDMPAKRAKFDVPMTNLRYGRIQEKEIPKNKNMQYDDPWGDDFAEEDIKEMDFVASQACLLEGNVLDNSKLGNNLHLMKSKILEKPAAIKSVQGTSRVSQDIADINYSQFKNKLIVKKDHNSTFQKERNFIIPDDRELERLKNENKKLLNDFITKDGETVFLRQQLQQIQLRAENEKLQKMHLIEDQANRHRSEINKICKEKEQLKTQIELRDLEIGNLLARCKQLESGNIKIRELQSLHTNNFLNKSKCNTSNNWPTNIDKNLTEVKDVCIQTNIYMKTDYQLKTCNTYFSLARISELMFGASVPEKPIINVKVIEKTGKRNLPILQEEERFRIFENPDLVKPVVTIVDGKKLTTEFVLLELAAIERKINAEIESESYTPIINKLILTMRELMLNVIMVLQTIFHAMKNDDIRDMNDLYFSAVYKDHHICIKSECEADAWHEGERGIEARRLLGALSHISWESTYLSSYLAGKSPLHTRNDECYNRYLLQMTRYNAWPKRNHKFEILEMIKEYIVLIGRVRRSHQFTGLINAIIKLLCNVQEKVGYCEKGLEYVCFIFKELVFSRPLSLCYASLAHFIMVFSRCNIFISKLCKNSQSMAIKNWKGALHFTPDACVLQILITQMEHFHPDFLTTLNMTHSLLSSVQYMLQTNNNLLRTESSETCNCYKKLIQFTINILGKCCETRSIVTNNINWQDLFYTSNKCYTLKKINYKDYGCRTKYDLQNKEKHAMEIYPEKLDRNFWSNIKKTQHQVLKEGIRFLCYLTICDPYFFIQSLDIEDSFNLLIRNITFFDDLILHENDREALERIKSTYILDKGVQNEIETHHKNIRITQLNIANFEKKVIPATKNDVKTTLNFDKIHMAIKALYNFKLEYKDN
ncbi:uncharacterized protein LOC105191407 isoform X2 [Harpegnathos saltator]|uniref:uncharacterized protein LOC105191407 isoform X2 n=1 Tax=Harpegnathos saltator TaxID=610380 RepID=UPI000948CB72|nr:uncharacterized protein LOC105191407 isoform X2 [Harpegnathos saltator]